MSIGDAFLPEFDDEMATTRRLLELVPGDKGPWKPTSASTTFRCHPSTVPAPMPPPRV